VYLLETDDSLSDFWQHYYIAPPKTPSQSTFGASKYCISHSSQRRRRLTSWDVYICMYVHTNIIKVMSKFGIHIPGGQPKAGRYNLLTSHTFRSNECYGWVSGAFILWHVGRWRWWGEHIPVVRTQDLVTCALEYATWRTLHLDGRGYVSGRLVCQASVIYESERTGRRPAVL
jgi:hypothetical protein